MPFSSTLLDYTPTAATSPKTPKKTIPTPNTTRPATLTTSTPSTIATDFEEFSKFCHAPAKIDLDSDEIYNTIPRPLWPFPRNALLPKPSTALIPEKSVPWFFKWYWRGAKESYVVDNIYNSVLRQTCKFLEDCPYLPHTLQSWYLVVILHNWMIFVRLRREGKPGKNAGQTLFDFFWSDAERRMLELNVTNPFTIGRLSKHFAKVYFGHVVAYDEGILENEHTDMILAEALWRNLFTMSDMPAYVLENVVHYVRREMNVLDNNSKIMEEGIFGWGPVPHFR